MIWEASVEVFGNGHLFNWERFFRNITLDIRLFRNITLEISLGIDTVFTIEYDSDSQVLRLDCDRNSL